WFLLVQNLDAHAAGSPGNDAERGLFIGRVHVLEFQLHDVHHLLAGDFADLAFVRRLRAGRDPRGLLEQRGRGRRLRDESKRLVLVNGNDHGNDHAALIFGGSIELLAEAHDVDAVLTERGTYWRRGV